MMGHQLGEQAALFYEFSLERHVPPNHLLRSINRFVELDGHGKRRPQMDPNRTFRDFPRDRGEWPRYLKGKR